MPGHPDRAVSTMVRLRRRPSRRAAGELDDLLLAQFDGPDQPLSAYDLCERIGRKGDPVAPAQVYRTLRRLAVRSAVQRIESLSAYVRSSKPVDLVSICSICQRVVTEAAPEIPALVGEAASAEDFEVRQIVVEIFGRCAQCQLASSDTHRIVQQ